MAKSNQVALKDRLSTLNNIRRVRSTTFADQALRDIALRMAAVPEHGRALKALLASNQSLDWEQAVVVVRLAANALPNVPHDDLRYLIQRAKSLEQGTAPELWLHSSVAHIREGDGARALQDIAQAWRVIPHNPDATWLAYHAFALTGRLREAFACAEYGIGTASMKRHPPLVGPQSQFGQCSTCEYQDHLVTYEEQGHGDTLFYLLWAAELVRKHEQLGGRDLQWDHYSRPAMIRFVRHVIDRMYDAGDLAPLVLRPNVYTHLRMPRFHSITNSSGVMSILQAPHHVLQGDRPGVQRNYFDHETHPVSTVPRLPTLWRSPRWRDGRILVTYQSREASHLDRTIKADPRLPLWRHPSVATLQYGHKLPGVEDACANVKDLMDTAEVIERSRCLITVDSVTAHIAGLLGHPTILAGGQRQEWKFSEAWRQRNGAHQVSAFYPSIRFVLQHDGESDKDYSERLLEEALAISPDGGA